MEACFPFLLYVFMRNDLVITLCSGLGQLLILGLFMSSLIYIH